MSIIWKILSRILSIPLITMIAYEAIRIMDKIQDSIFGKIIVWPNLFLQKFTTREPTKDMVEVAYQALQKLLQLEEEIS